MALIKKEAFTQIERIMKKEKLQRPKLTERRLERLLKTYKKTDILNAFNNNVKKILLHYDTCKEIDERTRFLGKLRSRTSLRSLTSQEVEQLAKYGYKYKIVDKGKRSERVYITKA